METSKALQEVLADLKSVKKTWIYLIYKVSYCKRMILYAMRAGIRKCCKAISKQFLVNLDKISFQ